MFRTGKLENPEKRRRKGKFPVFDLNISSEGETSMAANMAASTGKSASKEQKSKDSPKPNNASSSGPFGIPGSIPGFPAPSSTGPSMFGAPTYLPNNPWQSDVASKLDYIITKVNKLEQNQESFIVRLGQIENKMTETNIKEPLFCLNIFVTGRLNKSL